MKTVPLIIPTRKSFREAERERAVRLRQNRSRKCARGGCLRMKSDPWSIYCCSTCRAIAEAGASVVHA